MHYGALLLASWLVCSVAAAADLEFEGLPLVKIEVIEGASQTQPIPRQRAREYSVRIERTGSGYVWASRNNVPLVKIESGAYVTYVATNGAGYIRVLDPAMRKAILSLPAEQREKEFTYMEHMVNRLGSLTYFGR
jgi:hypothetical protein